MSIKHYPLQTYLKLAITLQVRRMEREPPMIGAHFMICQEECMDTGLVRLLVIMVLFVFHLLNLSLCY